MMTRVKLCGLMSEHDVALAVEAGADALGFVTEYPVPVPWNLERERAAELVAAAPPFATTVAVVGGSVETMVAIARRVRPHVLQLHGDESLEEVQAVCQALAGTGTRAVKALRVDAETGEAMFAVAQPAQAARELASSGIAGLVVDSKTASRPAGTGVAVDWAMAAEVAAAVPLPFILAGGLTPENVAQAVRHVRPYAVDVISSVEREPGVKDGALMRRFVRAAKEALDA
ncbi:MAG: phosphoribosylanthranilate isomerase [Candidatus Brocadiia bacterium]